MNSTIQAERTAKALAAIAAETERLGGQLELPSSRFPNPAVKHTLTLEAIAEALRKLPAAAVAGADEGTRAVEPVEAIIAVGAEDAPANEETPAAPKTRKGQKVAPPTDADDWSKSGRGKEVGS